MNRTDFQNLAEIRLSEARTLLGAGHHAGAYYLAGYAVECALKACIAKRTEQYDFPDKKLVNQSYTHSVVTLLKVSGLEGDLQKEVQSNAEFGDNWEVTKDWSEETRYLANVTAQVAADLVNAIADSNAGVLTWLKKLW